MSTKFFDDVFKFRFQVSNSSQNPTALAIGVSGLVFPFHFERLSRERPLDLFHNPKKQPFLPKTALLWQLFWQNWRDFRKITGIHKVMEQVYCDAKPA